AQKIFEKFGCEVIPLYCEPDGNFPNHEANPEVEENLRELARVVVEEKADIGIGFDGDGDRVGIIDEKGRHHSADYVLLILAQDLLKRIPNSQIIFDAKVSQSLINGIRKAGGIPVMSKTGHSFIEAKMHELQAPLAGEISGHFFFAENYYGFDDAFLAALRILEILSRSEKTMSQLLDEIPKMIITPEYKVPCPDDKKFEIMKKVTEAFEKKFPCITIDGVRVNYDTTTWGAGRCSNTSPNLTLRFEAPTQEKLDQVKKLFADELAKYPEVDCGWYK
ncbi:MAG: phosphomannomutase/phosphoglucomutase, partial [Patescibacteria group bacterium]